MRAHIRTNIRTYIRTYARTYLRTYIHTYIHTYVLTYVHTCVHKYEHMSVHTYIRTYVHSYIYLYVRTFVRVDPVSTQHLWSDQLSCSSQWCHSFANNFSSSTSTSVPGKRSAPQVLVEALRNAPLPGYGTTVHATVSSCAGARPRCRLCVPTFASHASRTCARGGRNTWQEAIGHRGVA